MSFNDLLSPKPYRWPKEGDRPFRKAESDTVYGPLGAMEACRAVSIMDGFMLAGATLAEQVLRERSKRFDLIYPMLYCYRHAIETGLKWLITQYGPRVNILPEGLTNEHGLLVLWKHCMEISLACGAAKGEEDLKAVEKIVKEFHDWDKSGIAFRYATKTNGAVVKFPHDDIDIENLRDVMNGVANFFSGLDGWLDNVANA